MGRNATFLLLTLCALAPGCQLPIGSGFEIFRYSTRNLVEAPLYAGGDCVERMRDRKLAKAAWEAIVQSHPDQLYTVHYVRGFEDGYTDYLYAGGNGEPPVVPPFEYRKVSYETPEGVQAIEDWFAGFRRGTAAARASGQRELIVLPVSLPGTAPIPLIAPQPPPHPTVPAGPSLPMPRKLGEAGKEPAPPALP
ncbi:MAG: hypothetical protein K2R98_15355 [Gemmataceae bacterium]|nr:hypothetical protein [Gemmataceae bacterium]